MLYCCVDVFNVGTVNDAGTCQDNLSVFCGVCVTPSNAIVLLLSIVTQSTKLALPGSSIHFNLIL